MIAQRRVTSLHRPSLEIFLLHHLKFKLAYIYVFTKNVWILSGPGAAIRPCVDKERAEAERVRRRKRAADAGADDRGKSAGVDGKRRCAAVWYGTGCSCENDDAPTR